MSSVGVTPELTVDSAHKMTECNKIKSKAKRTLTAIDE